MITSPIPFEQSDPELAAMLQEVVEQNSKVGKKDHLVVDFEREKVFYRTARSTKKVGRNEPCPCGSGKKYKKCCGKS